MGIFLSILSLFTGVLPAITKEIAQARVDLAKSKTEQEKIAAQERVKTLEARRDVLVAEAGTPWNSITRFLLTFPAIVYVNWLIYDKTLCPLLNEQYKALGQCSTDPLSPWLTSIFGVIIGFYFLTDLTRIIKR